MTVIYSGSEPVTVGDIRALVGQGLADAALDLMPDGTLGQIEQIHEWITEISEQSQRIEEKLDTLIGHLGA